MLPFGKGLKLKIKLNNMRQRTIIKKKTIIVLLFIFALVTFFYLNYRHNLQNEVICVSNPCSELGRNELLDLEKNNLVYDTLIFPVNLVIASKNVIGIKKYKKIIDNLNLINSKIKLKLNPKTTHINQEATIDKIELYPEKRENIEQKLNKKTLTFVIVSSGSRLRGFTFTLSENFGYYLGLGYNTIYIGDKKDIGLATFAHETGHYFGLQHTFGSSAKKKSTKEKLDGSNCRDEGDYICDTPADFNLPLYRDCGQSIPNVSGNYSPPINNYMSYSPENCKNTSTEEQLNRMHLFAYKFRKR